MVAHNPPIGCFVSLHYYYTTTADSPEHGGQEPGLNKLNQEGSGYLVPGEIRPPDHSVLINSTKSYIQNSPK